MRKVNHHLHKGEVFGDVVPTCPGCCDTNRQGVLRLGNHPRHLPEASLAEGRSKFCVVLRYWYASHPEPLYESEQVQAPVLAMHTPVANGGPGVPWLPPEVFRLLWKLGHVCSAMWEQRIMGPIQLSRHQGILQRLITRYPEVQVPWIVQGIRSWVPCQL